MNWIFYKNAFRLNNRKKLNEAKYSLIVSGTLIKNLGKLRFSAIHHL